MINFKLTTGIKTCGSLLLGAALLFSTQVKAAPPEVERAVSGDFDGDGKTDILVTRPALAGDTHKMWLARFSSGAPHTPAIFGLSSDTEMTADFDGDGVKDLVVYRPDHITTTPPLVRFYTAQTTGGITERTFGLTGDRFFSGYFDYDDKEELVAVRKINGGLTWFIALSDPEEAQLPPVLSYNWGLESDTPFLANMDGDNYHDLVVMRDNHIPGFKSWFINRVFYEEDGADHQGIVFGLSTDTALPPADFNGDGAADLIISRVEGNFTYIFVRLSEKREDRSKASSEPQILSFQFGLKDDILLPGNHFDAEKANILAFRRGQGNAQAFSFLTLPGSSTLFDSSVPFGLSSDTLISPQGHPIPPAAGGETVVPQQGGGSLASVCSTIHAPFKGFLWKPASDHSGFPREGKPMIAWQSGGQPSGKTCLRVLNQNGQVVTQFGRYATGGHYGARWYSGWGCGEGKHGSVIASQAQSSSGNRSVYVESTNGRCIGPINPTARNGSL